MEENVQLFDLSSVELTTSVNMMENIKEEMKIVIRDIKEQDAVRGLYSLSKSKAADVIDQIIQWLVTAGWNDRLCFIAYIRGIDCALLEPHSFDAWTIPLQISPKEKQ